MKLSKGSKVVSVLAVLTLLLFFFRLYFRAAIYADMYIARDEPYGISDIIELLLAAVFMFLSIVSLITALVLWLRGVKQSKIFAAGLVILNLILYLSFSALHALAAHYASG